MPAPSTLEEFVDLGLKAGILERDSVSDYCARFQEQHPDYTPEQLAQAMVRDGLLTPFQAEHLLRGRWRGFVLCKKYRLLECIGSGGMGSVYLCEHLLLRRKVAIKILPAAQAKDPEILARFYREARAVASLSHPNIVRADDIDQDDNLHFLVMEYVDGYSLQKIIKNNGPLSVERAANYIAQSANGLQHAHEAGLVHRDIKPGNLLLERTGEVKVLDLGLARFFFEENDQLTKKHDANSVLGTADYLAPEQAMDSHNVDIRGDIYSLGATFYFLLTGHAPFHDKSVPQKLIAHQLRQPPPIENFRKDVPAELIAVLKKMMAKRPEDRYQQPYEVAQALEPWTRIPVSPPPAREMPKNRTKVFSPDNKPLVDSDVPITRKILEQSPAQEPQSPPSPQYYEQHDLNDPQSPTRISSSTDSTCPTGHRPLPADNEKAPQSEVNFAPELIDRDAATTIYRQSRKPSNRLPILLSILAGGLFLVVSAVAAIWLNLPGEKKAAVKDSSPNKKPSIAGSKAPPDFGGFYKPSSRQTEQVIQVFKDHSDPVESVEISADGRWLATASWDKTVRVYDLKTGRLHKTIKRHWNKIHDVAISPNGKLILSACWDNNVRILDLTNGNERKRFGDHKKPVDCVAISPKGDIAISGGRDHLLRVWDIRNRRKRKANSTFKGHTDSIWCIAFSPDGEKLLSGSYDASVRLWEVSSGKELRQFPGPEVGVHAVAYSPDGIFVAAGGKDKKVWVWNADSGKLVRTFAGHKQTVAGLCFSPDGRYLVSCGDDKTARIWDLMTGGQVLEISDSAPIWSVACTPDGNQLITGGRSNQVKVIRLPEFMHCPEVGQQRVFWRNRGYVSALAVAPDGKEFASTGAKNTIELWSLKRGQATFYLTGHLNDVNDLAFSPDGKYLVSSGKDNKVILWDSRTKRKIRLLEGHKGEVRSVSFSPDGKSIVSGSADKTARLWDVETGKTLRILHGHRNDVWGVCFAPDNREVATASSDRTIRFWDNKTGKKTREIKLRDMEPRLIRFTSDGKRLICTTNRNKAQVWKIDSKKPSLQHTLEGHTNRLASLAVAKGSNYGLTGGEDGRLILWDLNEGRAISFFKEHFGVVSSANFFGNGQKALSGSSDTSIRLWGLPGFVSTRKEEKTTLIQQQQSILAAAVSPDGSKILTGGQDTTINLWSTASGRLIRTLSGHSGPVIGVKFSNQGRYCLSCSVDQSIILWDLYSGRKIRKFVRKEGNILSAHFSADGENIISVSADGQSTIWDAVSGKELDKIALERRLINQVAFAENKQLNAGPSGFLQLIDWSGGKTQYRQLRGQKGNIHAVAISPDETKALSGGQGKSVRYWDLTSGNTIHRFTNPSHPISCVAFSPDGQKAVAGDNEGEIHYWDLNQQKLLRSYPAHAGAVTSIAFTRDGKNIFSASKDGTVQRWTLPSLYPASALTQK